MEVYRTPLSISSFLNAKKAFKQGCVFLIFLYQTLFKSPYIHTVSEM